LGPHLKLERLIKPVFLDLITQSIILAPDEATEMVLKSAQEMWIIVIERINVVAALRTFPIGIPSLMSSVLPLETPVGSPLS